MDVVEGLSGVDEEFVGAIADVFAKYLMAPVHIEVNITLPPMISGI